MEYGEAIEVLDTHRAAGAPRERLICCRCLEEWPCRALSEAVHVAAQMAVPLPARVGGLRWP